MKQESVTSRLKAYLAQKGMNAKDFERITGLGNGTAARLSEATRETTYDRISNSGIDLNIDWLRTGEGEMLKSDCTKSERNVRQVGRPFTASGLDEGVFQVRFFQVTPTATFQEFCAGASEYPEFMPLIPPPDETIDDSSCVFEICGNSMSPQIPDGARVLCSEVPASRWHRLSEGVIVIAYADSFVIKRIVKNRLDSENYILLCSDNPDFPGSFAVQRSDIRCIFEARQVLSYRIR